MLVTGVAIAKPRAGKYTGHYGTHATSKLSLSVKGKTLRNFVIASAPAFCSNTFPSQYRFEEFYVPKAKIHGNKVNATYVVKNNKGLKLAKRHITATFHGGHVTGTLDGYDYDGCIIAKYSWTAQHR